MSKTHNEALRRALVAASKCGAMAAQRDVGLFTDKRGNLRKVGINGEADIQGVTKDGRALAIEVKTGNAVLSKVQRIWRDAWLDRQGVYTLARFSDTEDGAATIMQALRGWPDNGDTAP